MRQTNPAESGTRKHFAESIERDVIHGNDSPENAAIGGSGLFLI